MRRSVPGPVILLVAALVGSASAGQAERTATIVDTTGVTSEVTALRFSDGLERFDNSYGRLAFSAPPFDIAIPLAKLISVQAQGKDHAVTYLWRGKECTETGKLFSGEFTGKSDFGDLKLNSSKLKSIQFDRPPKTEKEKKAPNPAVLVLNDGTNVAVDTVKRHDRYYSTEGYLIGGSTRYRHYTDFRFLRGESLATVDFAKIKLIAFTGEEGVSVTLKNGKKASGTISRAHGADIVGFTGAFQKGEFFIAKTHVKAIEFGPADE